MKNREGVFNVFLSYIYCCIYHIYGSMFILYTYVQHLHIHSPVKVYLSKWKSTLFQSGKHIYLPSTWGDGVEPLRFRESTSLSEKETIRARLFSILCDCEVALWAHISYVIDCYCIMFRNYSFVMFVVRPKRFCPFDPFGVLRLCLGMPLCYIYTHIMQADAWILSLCVSFGCYLQMWCVNVWNHVCIRWEHENSKRYSRSA